MRVLVVEDEVRLAAACATGWRRRASRSTSPTTAPTGCGWPASTPYDAIVLDIMLPGLNGYRVCETLRAEGNWTPILMLTAKDGEWDEVEALDTGADDYLTKPFSFVVLSPACARCCAAARTRAARPCSTAGDLRLDPAARRVPARRRRGRRSPPASSRCSSS